jgi:hypothetical protein
MVQPVCSVKCSAHNFSIFHIIVFFIFFLILTAKPVTQNGSNNVARALQKFVSKLFFT